MTHLKWNKYLRRQNRPYETCSRLLCVNIWDKNHVKFSFKIAILTYWMLCSCSKRCLDLWWMHFIMFIHVSKIWTVSKLELLIAWLANTNCVESGLLYNIISSLTILNVSLNSLKAYCFRSAYCYAPLTQGRSS